eukprot:3623785-Ditylum_brightwellii.AAC.1
MEAFLSREEGGGKISSNYKDSNGQQYISPLRLLDEGVAIAHHHDGVSGTSKQHVAYDYAKRIQAGINNAEMYVTGLLSNFFISNQSRYGGGGGGDGGVVGSEG